MVQEGSHDSRVSGSDGCPQRQKGVSLNSAPHGAKKECRIHRAERRNHVRARGFPFDRTEWCSSLKWQGVDDYTQAPTLLAPPDDCNDHRHLLGAILSTWPSPEHSERQRPGLRGRPVAQLAGSRGDWTAVHGSGEPLRERFCRRSELHADS